MKRSFQQLWETTHQLFLRDLKTRYAGSLLGPLWIIVHPLALTLIASAVFSLIFPIEVAGIPYVLYVLLGFCSWVLLSQTLLVATRSLSFNRELILNATFPFESIIVSIVASRLIDYLASLLLFGVLMLIFVGAPPVGAFLLFLGAVCCQLLFQTGLSLFTAAANVYFRDVQYLVEIGLQLWFYATPILYAPDMLPANLRGMVRFNPLAQILTLERDALFSHALPLEALGGTLLISLTTFVIGLLLFRKAAVKFAEIL